MAIWTDAEKKGYLKDINRRIGIVKAGGSDQNGASLNKLIAEYERVAKVEWEEDSNGDTIDDTTPTVEKKKSSTSGGSSWDYFDEHKIDPSILDPSVMPGVDRINKNKPTNDKSFLDHFGRNALKDQDKSFGQSFYQGIGDGLSGIWDGFQRGIGGIGANINWLKDFIANNKGLIVTVILGSFAAKMFRFKVKID